MVISHRDYWFVSLDDGMILTVSRDSKSGVVLVSAMVVDGDEIDISPAQQAFFDPDDLAEGTVMASEKGTKRTVTKVTKAPNLTQTR